MQIQAATEKDEGEAVRVRASEISRDPDFLLSEGTRQWALLFVLVRMIGNNHKHST